MKVLQQIITLRIRALGRKESLPELLMTGLIAWLYFYMGMQVATLLNTAGAARNAENYILLALLISPFMAAFVPAFTIKKQLLPGYLPLKANLLFMADMLFALGRRPAIAGLSCLLGLILYANTTKAVFLVQCILFTANAILLAEVVTNIITWRKYKLLLPLAATALLVFFVFNKEQSPAYIKILCIAVAAIILLLLCRLSFSLLPPALSGKAFKFGIPVIVRSIPLYREVLLNNTAITVLAIAIIIKIVVLFVVPVKADLQHHSMVQNPLQFLFFTPVFIFAYVFNNTFGFFRSLFFSVWLYRNTAAEYLKVYFKLLLPFLLVDVFISLSFLLYNRAFTVNMAVFYVLMCVYYIAVSLISSVAGVRMVDGLSVNIFKKNTPTIANLVLIAPSLLLVYYYKNTGPYLVQTASAFTAVIALAVLWRRYKNTWAGYVLKKLK